MDLDGDGNMEIVATEFFAQKDLAIYSCANGRWSNCSPSNGIERHVIADGDGSYFNVRLPRFSGLLSILYIPECQFHISFFKRHKRDTEMNNGADPKHLIIDCNSKKYCL